MKHHDQKQGGKERVYLAYIQFHIRNPPLLWNNLCTLQNTHNSNWLIKSCWPIAGQERLGRRARLGGRWEKEGQRRRGQEPDTEEARHVENGVKSHEPQVRT